MSNVTDFCHNTPRTSHKPRSATKGTPGLSAYPGNFSDDSRGLLRLHIPRFTQHIPTFVFRAGCLSLPVPHPAGFGGLFRSCSVIIIADIYLVVK